MPAELINTNAKETMKNVANKLNKAIQNAYDAINNSKKADVNSNDALRRVKSVQSQLNAIVKRESDSNAETAQMRVDLNNVEHETANERLVADFTKIIDQIADLSSLFDLSKMNSLNLSNYYKKMQNANGAPIGNDVKIACRGDSLTSGNGASSGGDYPNRLKNFLVTMARDGQTITVENQGIGGDTTKMSYNNWPLPSGADLCIIFLGTNDYNKNISMSEFVTYYEMIIKKEILGGAGVLLVTPHKWRKADWLTKENNGSIADYVAVIKDFGRKYNAPVLDLHAETRNLDISAYKTGEADPGIHFSDVGYQMLSQKLAAMVGIQHPSTLPVVTHNSFLGVRPSIDGIKQLGEYYIMHTSESYPTPQEYVNGAGTGITTSGTEKLFYYAFYAAEDNLAIIPSFFFTATDGTEKLDILINNNNIPFHPNNLYQYSQGLNRNLPIGRMNINMSHFTSGHAGTAITQNVFVNPKVITYRYLPTKGWYTITVKANQCRFHGFDFLNTNQLKIFQELYTINPQIVNEVIA